MSTSEPTAAPAIEPGATPAVRGDGGRVRGIVLIVLGGMFLVAVGASYFMAARNKGDSGPSRVQSVAQPDGTPNAPTNNPSPRYMELTRENNAQRVDEAVARGEPVVLAPLVGAGAPEPVAPKPYQPQTVQLDERQRAHDRSDLVARRIAALTKASANWNSLPAQGLVAGSPRAPRAVATAQAGEGVRLPPPPSLPLLTVMNAVVDVGANSDYPAEMIVRLVGGPLAGAKFLGQVQNSRAGTGGLDRLTMRFTKMLWRDTYYSVDGLAVDAGTRIPAVKGDINRHLVHNIVHQAGAAFAAIAALQPSFSYGITVGPTGGITGTNPYTVEDVVRSTAAQSVAGTLRQNAFRGPTVTMPAGTAIGVVLIAPPRIDTAAHESLAALTPGAPATVAVAKPPPEVIVRSIAPDGTPIVVGSAQ